MRWLRRWLAAGATSTVESSAIRLRSTSAELGACSRFACRQQKDEEPHSDSGLQISDVPLVKNACNINSSWSRREQTGKVGRQGNPSHIALDDLAVPVEQVDAEIFHKMLIEVTRGATTLLEDVEVRGVMRSEILRHLRYMYQSTPTGPSPHGSRERGCCLRDGVSVPQPLRLRVAPSILNTLNWQPVAGHAQINISTLRHLTRLSSEMSFDIP